jgi:hypothetical protein
VIFLDCNYFVGTKRRKAKRGKRCSPLHDSRGIIFTLKEKKDEENAKHEEKIEECGRRNEMTR